MSYIQTKVNQLNELLVSMLDDIMLDYTRMPITVTLASGQDIQTYRYLVANSQYDSYLLDAVGYSTKEPFEKEHHYQLSFKELADQLTCILHLLFKVEVLYQRTVEFIREHMCKLMLILDIS